MSYFDNEELIQIINSLYENLVKTKMIAEEALEKTELGELELLWYKGYQDEGAAAIRKLVSLVNENPDLLKSSNERFRSTVILMKDVLEMMSLIEEKFSLK
jgi:hypothetical protein